jgi:hypothetical protein
VDDQQDRDQKADRQASQYLNNRGRGAHARHLQICNHHRRKICPHRGERLQTTRGRGYFEPVGAKHPLQLLQYQLVVVDQQYPERG